MCTNKNTTPILTCQNPYSQTSHSHSMTTQSTNIWHKNFQHLTTGLHKNQNIMAKLQNQKEKKKKKT